MLPYSANTTVPQPTHPGHLHYVMYTECYIVAIVQCTLYTIHCIIYTVKCVLHCVHCTLLFIKLTLYIVHYAIKEEHGTIQSVQCSAVKFAMQ